MGSRKRETERAAEKVSFIGRIPAPVWAAITATTTAAVGWFMKRLHERAAKPH